MIRFTATVNGHKRSVTISETDIPKWVSLVLPDDSDLDAIEEVVMNIEPYYREFYEGADESDFNADVTDRYIDRESE